MSVSPSTHTHQLSNGQLICDNDQCRERVSGQIQQLNEELKQEFDRLVQENASKDQIDQRQAWNIIRLLSRSLSHQLSALLNDKKIASMIEEYAEKNSTQQAFRDAFEFESQLQHGETKKSPTTATVIRQDQLWNIYQRICRDAIRILSKSSTERKNHVANFLALDENGLL